MEKRPNTQTRKTKTIGEITRQFNPKYKPTKGEYNDGQSITVPDMSLTVKKLLENHSRGIHSDVKYREPMYFDTEIPKFDDITERIEYQEELLEREKEINDKIKEEKRAVKLKKAEKTAKVLEAKKALETELKTAEHNDHKESKKP